MVPSERWPPVYDLDGLLQEIRHLTERPDFDAAFYEWRLDRSTCEREDVCQGDVVMLESEVPVISDDGQPSVVEHPTGTWLVLGNTCDLVRVQEDARWTQLAPICDLGARADVSPAQHAALRRYTPCRRFYMPPWSADSAKRVHIADLPRIVAVDKRALGKGAAGRVYARMSRAAWALLNACLVRFLARDDGRDA